MLEAWLVGRWICSAERESSEYAFLADNQFTSVVTRPGEPPLKMRGYWDVLGEQLRMGTTPLTANPARMVATGRDSFSATLSDGSVMRFQKVYPA